ncbi:hypothetical protein FHR83_001501 [Actinoplanes campanulatus]|uniref:DUF2613 domain-containing protein n=1 Tax=Actinoplanes campanulatus TaxID=113559 RepID=A0A7W5FD21_9ACTN|nr:MULTISPECIES: hypothetical protein [Actinoplanes]MBB3093852.1 hypothetical protein [Actinoplanes campanulatus]GGN06076.1 hypothetical protein GCM10010109_13720 [Actinoplanes campanulatus]GID35073.1 hypothetical protein Aca09nite_15790 [Actinoplanes campanulatus]GID50548.1 hypothetical protein Aca07nite_78230 [Actinoplanes capillaceus]
MAKLATFVIATFAGGILGIVGVVAAVGAANPSADTVASVSSNKDPKQGDAVYGVR